MVRLTASVYHHPPLFPSAFCDFFGVFLNLDYDYMCSETDFAQEKVIFIQLRKSPFLLTACCYSVTKSLDSGKAEALTLLGPAYLSVSKDQEGAHGPPLNILGLGGVRVSILFGNDFPMNS